MFNPSDIKKDFPLLSRPMSGKPIVYLDSAATTQKPKSVIDAITTFYNESNANIHRGVYPVAEEATRQFEETRERVAKFINAPSARSIVFTRNTTEAINLVAQSWARKYLKKGDEILITDFEHHANLVPWYLTAQETGAILKSAPLTPNFELDLDGFKKLLTPKTKLVAVTAMSNVLGTIVPVETVTKLAHANGSLVLIDGAQSVPHLPTDIQKIGCDFFAFSAHKMLGPTGVGILWAKEELLEKMEPYQGGGEMISIVTLEKITWADIPHKFEAGTPNFADTAAFSASLDYLEKIGMTAIRAHEKELVSYALKALSTLTDITIYGTKDPEKQGGAISFNHKTIHAHDVGTILADDGVAIRVGHHCAQPLMKTLDVSSTARASFYIYNTKEDIDALVASLKKVNEVFGYV